MPVFGYVWWHEGPPDLGFNVRTKVGKNKKNKKIKVAQVRY